MKNNQQKSSEVKIEYKEITPQEEVEKHLNEISGVFGSSASVPTNTPKKLSDQIRVGTQGLYIYDSPNKAWRTIGQTIGCRLYRSSTQSISGTTTVSWNAEDYDTDSMHDLSTNPTRITFTTAGKYMIECMLTTTATGTGTVRGRINTSTGTTIAYDRITGAGHHTLKMTTTYEFTAGQYIEVFILEDIGGNFIDGQNTDASTHISVFKI